MYMVTPYVCREVLMQLKMQLKMQAARFVMIPGMPVFETG